MLAHVKLLTACPRGKQQAQPYDGAGGAAVLGPGSPWALPRYPYTSTQPSTPRDAGTSRFIQSSAWRLATSPLPSECGRGQRFGLPAPLRVRSGGVAASIVLSCLCKEAQILVSF